MSETLQNYKNDYQKRNISKEILCEFLDFIRFKIANDRLTSEEAYSLVESILRSLPLRATVKELARFYGQSEHNVRCVINRKVSEKPQRRVYYSFSAFSKAVPDTWKKCRKDKSDT